MTSLWLLRCALRFFCCVTSSLICSTLGLFCFVSCSIHYSRSGSSQTGAGTDGNTSSTGFCEGHGDGTTDSHEGAADEDTFALAFGVSGVDGWVCFVMDSRCGFITLKRCHPCAIRIGLWDVIGCSQQITCLFWSKQFRIQDANQGPGILKD